MSAFEVRTSLGDGQIVIALSGECDLAERPALNAALQDAVGRCPLVVVDLTGLTFIDSTGINALIAAHRAARDRRGRVYVRGASGMVATVMTVTGVAELLALPDGCDDPVNEPPQ